MSKFKKLWICQKNFFKSNFFMQMFNVSVLCMQSIKLFHQNLWYQLISPCMHYVSTNQTPIKKQSVRNWLFKLKHLSICHILFFSHQISSCKCSMCLHCVCTVSDCFSKTCMYELISLCMHSLSTDKISGTSWFPSICTLYASKKSFIKNYKGQ